MRRHHFLATAATFGTLGWGVLGGWAVGQQRPAADQSNLERTERSLQEKGGIISVKPGGAEASRPGGRRSEAKDTAGRLIRPLVPSGGSADEAPEEGDFTLRPGDMLELECAAPKDREANLSYKVDDEGVVKLMPSGVRQLVPMAMVGGKPMPITGMTRTVALFQAEKEGKTTIHMNLGTKPRQYHVEVRREEPVPEGAR